MGKKPRSKGVDVTKSLLQPPSKSDYIAVQVAPSTVVTVTEEELSPTQGSEAAFALRREGKLDSTMKLCLNWRAGACHNYAACTFAHITQYYGVDNNSATTAAAASTGPADHSSSGPSSRPLGAGGAAANGGGAGSGEARSPWLSKVAASASGGASAGGGSAPSWGAKGTPTATSGRGYVDLAEAMAAKASQQQNRTGRALASAATTTSTPRPSPAPTPAAQQGSQLPAATTQPTSETPPFVPTGESAVDPAPRAATAAPAAPAVQDILWRQLTGGESGGVIATAPGTVTAAAATGALGDGTPRHQGVPAPRSGVFSASPFSTSPYAAAQPSQWSAGLGAAATSSARGARVATAPWMSPTLGSPSPTVRRLMALLTAEE